MGWLFKILFVFPMIFSLNWAGKSFSNEDKLAECLRALLRDSNLTFMRNIRMHIEVESKIYKQKFENIVEKFSASNDRVTVELHSEESVSYSIQGRVYFIDSLTSLNSLEAIVKEQREKDRDFTAANQNYIIVLPGDILNFERIIERTFHMCWGNSIINANVLVEDANGVVTVYTFYPFNEKRCSDSTPTIYNHFVNGSLEWDKPTFPSKTKNFWQCPVRAVLWHEPPFIVLDPMELSGLDGVILHTLATDMNFSLQIIESPEGKGLNYPNGTATGAFKLLEQGLGDLTMGGIAVIKLRQEFFAATRAYFMSNVWIVIKRLDEYSPMEILLFPFDLYTWLSLLILFLGNWIGRILWKSIAAAVVPFWEYSMQLRLIAWLLTALILRSSYEGSIFQFLHNKPSKAPPNNLDETIDAGYTFVVWPAAFLYFSIVPELKDKMITIDASKTEIFEMYTTMEGRYGVFIWLDILSQYNNDSSKYEEYYIVPEPVMSVHPCVYLPKFSYLTRVLNGRLEQMVTHGRIDKIIERVAPIDNFLKKKKVKKTQESLTLHQLMGTFQVLGVFFGVSALIFLMEILSNRSQTLRTAMEFLQ